ncbi:MAG: exodeoxyribonuclease V subunit alpha [Betaproteobacteria bacterium]
MTGTLLTLMESGQLPPLCYYFARFVARGCGQPEDSIVALTAALVSHCNLDGDVCVDLAAFAGRPLFGPPETGQPAGPVGPALEPWLCALRAAPWVGSAPTPDSPSAGLFPLMLDGHRLYLGKSWQDEVHVAAALRARLGAAPEVDLTRLAEGLGRLFPATGPRQPDAEPDWQRLAAATAVGRRYAVISGGPGTGKTTTVVKVLALLLEQSATLRIALAAPTGKAAARLAEAVRNGKTRTAADPAILQRIPEEASTIHRLLGLGHDHRAGRNRDTPLMVDCLVVDEASMIDLPLMARLLDALPAPARLVLLGDRDQLASVEAGNVLGDITGRGREIRYSAGHAEFLRQVGTAPLAAVPTHEGPPGPADAIGLLKVSYRFAQDSGIGALSRAVNAGAGDVALDLLRGSGRRPDLAWLPAPPAGLNADCVEWAAQRYAGYLGQPDILQALRQFERARVLAALQQGPSGAGELNRLIERRLVAQGLVRGGDDYRGKPVMVVVNDYEVGLFNGDIGLLWPGDDGELRAWFLVSGAQTRSVPVRQLPEHQSAYALTVHKSQGSEFDDILLVLPPDPSPVVTRELLYTGITRARQRLTVHGQEDSFIAGCGTVVDRSSALAARLGWTAPDSPEAHSPPRREPAP